MRCRVTCLAAGSKVVRTPSLAEGQFVDSLLSGLGSPRTQDVKSREIARGTPNFAHARTVRPHVGKRIARRRVSALGSEAPTMTKPIDGSELRAHTVFSGVGNRPTLQRWGSQGVLREYLQDLSQKCADCSKPSKADP